MSSTIASVSRNTPHCRRARGRRAARARPTANAMSVAIGDPPARARRRRRRRSRRRATPATDHAAERGERRQRRGARGRAARPIDELALDLQPDDEEEERHQPVVDPVVQVEREPEPMRSCLVPEVLVGVAQRGVGPDQRDDRRGEQQRAARRPPSWRNSQRPGRSRPAARVGSCALAEALGERAEEVVPGDQRRPRVPSSTIGTIEHAVVQEDLGELRRRRSPGRRRRARCSCARRPARSRQASRFSSASSSDAGRTPAP